jgi:hypothetical protein
MIGLAAAHPQGGVTLIVAAAILPHLLKRLVRAENANRPIARSPRRVDWTPALMDRTLT